MSGDDLDEDPGWNLSRRTLLYMVPGYLAYRVRRGDYERDALETIRQLWLTFATAIILFGVAEAASVHGADKAPARPWIIGIAIATALLLAAEEILGRRSLACTNSTALAATYRSRFFTRTAISESIALAAFIGALTVGEWWLYWLFLPFALLGLARGAPTKRHLASEQHRLHVGGCQLSLVRALRQLPPHARQ